LRDARLGINLTLVTCFVLLVISSCINTVSADEEFVAVRGERVTISVILLQNGTYGDPISNQVIEFYDKTNDLLIGTNTTDSNGLAKMNWVIPDYYPLGATIVNATFRGNESLFLLPSYQNIVLNILAATEIILHDNPSSLAPGDMLSFSITLQDDTFSPLVNKTIFVFGNDNLLVSGVTNSTGSTLFSIHCNSSWAILGENTIRIVHDQDINNYYAKTETNFSLQIQQLQTTLLSNFSYDSITLGNAIDFEVNLTSIEGGISGNLIIQIDGNFISNMTTDITGITSIHVDIDERFSLNHHLLNIVYLGTERYSDTSLMKEFDIVSSIEFNITMSSSLTIGMETEMIISLYDNLNRSVEGSITITDISNEQNITIQIPEDTITISINFPVYGPAGLHNLLIEINNPFVINPSIIHNVTIWSKPVIFIHSSNILHYASPNQEIRFSLHLRNWLGNITFQPIQLLCNNELIVSSWTNEEGFTSFSFLAPSDEGIYNLSFTYSLNASRFELPTKLDYNLVVTSNMPVLVELDHYELVPPLQQISIYLRVQCLNGSFATGIPITITWQSIERSLLTHLNGFLPVNLPVPKSSGNYSLYYTIEQNYNLASSSGMITILVSQIDILTSQGIGITGFAIGFIASLTIFAIPLIRQKYLIM
jgi:hypothetical protein